MIHQRKFGNILSSVVIPAAIAISSDPINSIHGTLPPPLSISTFQDTIFSSIDDIFSYVGIGNEPSDLATLWWTNFTSYGWDLFLKRDEQSPFIVCHDGNMSGRSRSIDALNFFSKAEAITTISQDYENKILYNTKKLTCLYVMALPSKLVNLSTYKTDNDIAIVVQPVVSEMKAAYGLAAILKNSESFSDWWGGSDDRSDNKTNATDEFVTEPSNNATAPNLRSRRTSLASIFLEKPVRFQASLCSKLPKTGAGFDSFLENVRDEIKTYIETALQNTELGAVNVGDVVSVGIGGLEKLVNVSPDKCADWLLSPSVGIELTGDGSDLEFILPRPSLRSVFNGTHTDTDWVAPCVAIGVIALLNRNEVCSLSLRGDPKVDNLQARWITQGRDNSILYGNRIMGTGNSPFYNVDLKGTNQIVAVSDTGLDLNSCYFSDGEHTVVPHKTDAVSSTANRKVVQYVAFNDDKDTLNGHGTHVCGSIVGKVDPNASIIAKTLGFSAHGYQNGIAEDAQLSFFDLGDRKGRLALPIDTTDILLPGYKAGASFHSASWGTTGVNGYSSGDKDWDRFLHEHQDFLIFVAAGNDGKKGLNSVSSPAIAKNIIAVGASENPIDSGINAGFTAGLQVQNAKLLGRDYIAEFSSRGPTADGRIKPDVVAPGSFVHSAGAHPDNPGSCSTTSMQGTSMATPITTGNAIIVRQYFVEGFQKDGSRNFDEGIYPSAALIKAVLINGAQYLLGLNEQNDKPPLEVFPYDEYQGFGRISLLDSLPLKKKKQFSDVI